METKLLKIKLNPGSREKVDSLLAYMKSHIDFPKQEMEQKGYFWDSVFYDCEAEDEFLYIVLKSKSFSKIMTDEAGLISTPFREVYEKFRKECWAPEHYNDVEALFCFNKEVSFEA
ncbi:DUF6176 family protein [Pseudoalteromonas fenneropenaei]|uniref:DUF6176 family protein n=1 Tax=Pseudoalteromonas fenneropenaei TaxID=1737459 RepID=A0ABV7CJF0_9GAMM